MARNTADIPCAADAAMPIEELARLCGIRSEHVLLEGDAAAVRSDGPGRTARRRSRLVNRARGSTTTLTLFDEGYLDVTEERIGGSEHTTRKDLDLRYVDPRPVRSWRARSALLRSLSWLACGLVAGVLLAYWLPVPAHLSFLGAITPAAGLGLWTFVTRVERTVVFRTLHGRAPVFVIAANLGCLRAGRAVGRDVARAARDARKRDGRVTEQSLRAEIREHYRLAEAGVLSPEACASAVRQVLVYFE